MRVTKLVAISSLLVLASFGYSQTSVSDKLSSAKIDIKMKPYVTVISTGTKTQIQISAAPVNYYDKKDDSWKKVVESFAVSADASFDKASLEQQYPVYVSKDGNRKYLIDGSTSSYFSVGVMEQDIKNDGKWALIKPDSYTTKGNIITMDYKAAGSVELSNTSLGSKFNWTVNEESMLKPTRWLLSGSHDVSFSSSEEGVDILQDGKFVSRLTPFYIVKEGTVPVHNKIATKFDNGYVIIDKYPTINEFPVIIDPSVVYSTQPAVNADTRLVYDTDTNYGGSVYTTAGSTTSADYKSIVALLKFDLTSLSGKTILGATFYMYNSESGWRDRGTVKLWRVLVANDGWVAGTGDGNPITGTSCWLYKLRATTNWAGIACNVVGTDVSTAPLGGTITIGNNNLTGGEEFVYPFTTGEFRSMLAANYGFIATQPNNSGYFNFATSENTNATWRPKLIVEYDAPVAAASGTALPILMFEQ